MFAPRQSLCDRVGAALQASSFVPIERRRLAYDDGG